MVMRGVQKINSKTITAKMVGCFTNQAVKDEFYKLIHITP
jgi:GTP cyclohydrolase I